MAFKKSHNIEKLRQPHIHRTGRKMRMSEQSESFEESADVAVEGEGDCDVKEEESHCNEDDLESKVPQVLKTDLVEDESSQSDGDEKCFQCMSCTKKFKRSSHLKDHMQMHSGDRPFECSTCGKAFKRKSHLLRHNDSHTRVKKLSSVEKKSFSSSEDSFIKEIERECGAEVDMDTEVGLCPFCPKKFKYWNSFKKHVQLHSEERSFTCPYCSKKFKPKYLSEHIRVHTDERPFKCDSCEKSFKRRSHLFTHTLIHQKAKPFMCNLCGKSFASEEGLSKHMNTHDGTFIERPFACDICHKTFKASRHLMQHQLIHSNEKPFRCPLCDKSFNRMYGLKRHMQVHIDR